MDWVRWWLVRLFMRRRGFAEIEHILKADACSECGSWRCLQCAHLIMNASDHSPVCRLYQLWR